MTMYAIILKIKTHNLLGKVSVSIHFIFSGRSSHNGPMEFHIGGRMSGAKKNESFYIFFTNISAFVVGAFGDGIFTNVFWNDWVGDNDSCKIKMGMFHDDTNTAESGKCCVTISLHGSTPWKYWNISPIAWKQITRKHFLDICIDNRLVIVWLFIIIVFVFVSWCSIKNTIFA